MSSAARARRGPSRRISALLIALGCASVAFWMALPHRSGAADSVPEIVRAAGDDPDARAQAVAAVLALGESAYRELVSVAARGTFCDGAPADAGGRALVAEALDRAPARPLVVYLARAGPGLDAELRATAMRLVATRGESRDVYVLFDLAVGDGPEGPGEWTDATAASLASALSELIRREPDTLDELRGGMFRMQDEVLRPALSAIGASGRSRAVGVLVDLLGLRSELDGRLLAELARLGPVADPDAARVAALRVRPYLTHDRGGLARAAVTALGRLGDPDQVGDMIEMLASEDAGLARTAFGALQLLTGLQLRQAYGPWCAWHDEQVRWSDDRLDATLDALQADSAAVVREALRELQNHPLERHLIAAEVALVLDRPEPELRVAAAQALGRLRSRAALEGLVYALADGEEAVEAAVHQALVELTGADHGRDPGPWLGALGGTR